MLYVGDKAQRITLRLSDKQFSYVKRSADMFGVSPSEFLRMVINMTMNVGQQASDALEQKGEGDGRENDKTDFNDIV